MNPPPSEFPVIHDHDGHIDDLISLAMLALAPNVKLRATTLCPADCYLEAGSLAVEKLLTLLAKTEIEFARGHDEGMNPFPDKYRKDSNHLPSMRLFDGVKETKVKVHPAENASQFLSRTLSGRGKFNIVETGPLTNIADAITQNPKIVSNINHLWVMGGAIQVPGNVEGEAGHDGSAEWNFYNHPIAAQKVISSGIPITLIPLDVTNSFPLERRFVEKLQDQSEFLLSKLAFEGWQIVIRNPENEYCLWDVLTVAVFLEPSLFRMEKRRISISTQGASQGRSVEDPSGFEVTIPQPVHREEVEQFFLKYFRR